MSKQLSPEKLQQRAEAFEQDRQEKVRLINDELFIQSYANLGPDEERWAATCLRATRDASGPQVANTNVVVLSAMIATLFAIVSSSATLLSSGGTQAGRQVFTVAGIGFLIMGLLWFLNYLVIVLDERRCARIVVLRVVERRERLRQEQELRTALMATQKRELFRRSRR